MALGDSLKITKLKGMSIDEGTCISSDIGDHFWYRNGGWEQLQEDGTYAACAEPTPKDTYKCMHQKSGKQYEYAKNGKDTEGKDDEWPEAPVLSEAEIEEGREAWLRGESNQALLHPQGETGIST